MDGLWPRIIKTTGAVGVVALLIYTVLNYVYSSQIQALFGSEKLFAITIIIISALLTILLVAIIKPKEKSDIPIQTEGPKVTYKDNSTHNGDNNF